MAKPDASSSTSSSSRGSGSAAETNVLKTNNINKIEIEIQKPNMKCVSSVDSHSLNMDTPIVDSTRAHNRKEKERMRKTLRENAKRLKLLEEQMQIISGAVSTTNGNNDRVEDRDFANGKIGASNFPSEVNPEVPVKGVQISTYSSSLGRTGRTKCNVLNKSKLPSTHASLGAVNPDANCASHLNLNTSANPQLNSLFSVSHVQANGLPFSLSRSSSSNTTPTSTPLQTPTEVVPPNYGTTSSPSNPLTDQALHRSTDRKTATSRLSQSSRNLEPPVPNPVTPPQTTNPAVKSKTRNTNSNVSSFLPAMPTANKATGKPPLFLAVKTNVPVSNSVYKSDHSSLTSPDSLDGFAGLNNNNNNGNMDFSIQDLALTSSTLLDFNSDHSVTSGIPTAADSMLQLQGLPSHPVPSPSPRRPPWFGEPF